MVAVVTGSGIGLLLKGRLKQRYQDTLMQGLGLAIIFIGAAGLMKWMLTNCPNRAIEAIHVRMRSPVRL